MRTGFWIIGAAFLGAAPAAAQDDPRQTPENAKLFIERTLPNSNYAWRPPNAEHFHRVASISPNQTSVCAITVNSVDQNTGQSTGNGDWDFRHIRGITHYSHWKNVELHLQGGMISVDAGSEATAARLAFAMEFLRQHCDPAVDTGF